MMVLYGTFFRDLKRLPKVNYTLIVIILHAERIKRALQVRLRDTL